MKEKLGQEGLFDDEYKQPLPSFPKTIGIVTSPTGAVLRDIYRVAKRRLPSIKLALFPVQVQGVGAEQQIAAGIDFFNKKYPVDVLIVGRGGGSMEDLWSFNEEAVVRAIFRSKIPVISAVGHETDFTLADFVADVRAATPSQAAELAVPDIGDVTQRIKSIKVRLALAAMAAIKEKRQSVEALGRSFVFTQPEKMLESRIVKIETLANKLNQLARQLIKDKKQGLLHNMEKLELINPMGVIRRGYGIVYNSDGAILSHIGDVKIDDVYCIKIEGGEFEAQVKSIKEE